jgi:methionyl-tRNA formyltransferase
MKIVYYGYRDWAINIFSKIEINEKYLINHKDYSLLDSLKPNLVFFIGWSDIIPNEIVEKYTCICLHPSPLPKYRGGSPIQNQIINEEKNSAVTFFIMDTKLDNGDIIYQPYLCLNGKLSKIFKDIELIGIEYINKIIKDYQDNNLKIYKQDNSEATFFKRRKESDSEITINEFLNNEPLYLYNKIRSLNDPYPNAFIKCKNGKKLFITESYYEE